MWTEQDEIQLQIQLAKKRAEERLNPLRRTFNSLNSAAQKHTSQVQEIRWDVQYFAYNYSEVSVNIILTGDAAQEFLQGIK